MRAQVREVAATRRALSVCGPFSAKFQGWTAHAALINARLAANRDGRVSILAELDDLRADVATSHAEFRVAVAGIPPHGRIADVEAAFTRLLAMVDRAGVTEGG